MRSQPLCAASRPVRKTGERSILARLLLRNCYKAVVATSLRAFRVVAMTRRCFGWVLSATLSLGSGSLSAAPEECLGYPDNPRVAACANHQYGYGPSAAGPRPRSTPGTATPATAQPANRPVQAGKDSELRTVVVNRGPKPPPPPEPEPPTFAVDRTMLTNTVVAGAVGGSLLILVALGAWRWGSMLKKACPYCGTKMSRSATSCRRCFRAL